RARDGMDETGRAGATVGSACGRAARADQASLRSQGSSQSRQEDRTRAMTALQTRRLGRTGSQVTELGLGCYQFTASFDVARDEADRILDFAFASGVNFFDTAAMYGCG